MLGEIKIFGGNYAPKGWKLCNGEKLRLRGNEALISVIGTRYGGDGRNYFHLPNIKNISFRDEKGGPTSAIYIINVSGTPPQRS